MIRFDETIDKSGMRLLLKSWPHQVEESWKSGFEIGLGSKGNPPDIIIWVGMGGSAIGGDFCSALMKNTASVQIIVHRGGPLPAWVNSSHHVLLASFSGNTAETLDVAAQAAQIGCSFDAMTSGGKLAELMRQNHVTPWQVPGGMPPRAALGHLFSCSLGVLAGRGWCNIQLEDIEEAIEILIESVKTYSIPPDDGSSKLNNLIDGLQNRFPMIYGTGNLTAVARRWAGQINENAKRPSHWGELPEMNHNEVVAYRDGSPWGDRCGIVILEDPDSPEDVRKRSEITLKIAEEAGWKGWCFRPTAKSPVARMLEMTILGDWLSYWMAIDQGVDPTPIPTIDKLKASLEK